MGETTGEMVSNQARRPRVSLGALALAGTLLLSAACRRDRNEPLPLAAAEGTTRSGWLAPGRTIEYGVLLAEGQFLEVVVEQRGVDLAAALIGPDGEPVVEADSPNAEIGPEPVLAVAGKSGRYRLALDAGDSPTAGAYDVRVVELGDCTPRNARRAAAAGHHWRGDALRGEGLAKEALAEYGKALDLWRAASDPSLEALTLHRIGQTHERCGQRSEAVAAYRQAVELTEALGARREGALLHSRVGNCQEGAGRHRSALDSFDRARSIFAEIGDDRREASMLNRLGLIHDQLGHWQDALRDFNLALKIWRDIDEPADEAVTLNNLAEVYVSLAQLPAAGDVLAKALDVRHRVGDRLGEARTLNTRGTVFRRSGELERARKDFERSLALHRELDDLAGMAVSLIGLGQTEVRQGRPDRALPTYNEALRLAKGAGDRNVEGYALLNIGWAQDGQDRPRQAMERFAGALALFARLGERLGEVSALFGIAKAHRSLGRLPEALERAEQALDRLEALRGASYSETLGASLAARKDNYYEFYVDVLMELHRATPEDGYAARALTASERSRTRSLVDALTEAAVDLRRGVDAELLEQEARLLTELDAKEMERLAAMDTPAGAAVERDLRALAIRYRELEARIRRSSPAYAALTRPRPPELEQVQELLDAETLLVEFSLGEERSYLFAVGSDSFSSHLLPGRAKIERVARSAHLLLVESRGNSGRTALELTLDTLGELLLGPLGETLARSRVKRLVVVADGLLQYVPFAALAQPATEDRPSPGPLVERFEILTPPSAAVMRTLRLQRATRRPARQPIAIFADPIFSRDDPRLPRRSPPESEDLESDGPALPRLPGTRQEAAAVVEMAAPEKAYLASGFDANLERATSGALAEFRIVHFATHGLIHAEHPELSAVVLSLYDRDGRSRPGHLRAHHIYNLELPAELVVLSACNTALGTEVRGEGLMSLTRGFMYAGARQVLVSLWNVDDRASAELMRTFYKKLLVEGRSPAAALRLAQLITMDDPRWRSPYYWAGYLLQGDLN